MLHTSCASLDAAHALLQVALQCGFKNSGIMLGKKIMVAVRSTLRLEVPLVHAGAVLVDAAYVRTLAALANGKMAENFARIAKFFAACQDAFRAQTAAVSAAAATAAAESAAAAAGGAMSCAQCPETFASRNKLFAHVRAAHPKPGAS